MKLYANDPGLYWAPIPSSSDGLAFLLETAVYLELRRRRKVGRLGDTAMLKLPSGKEVGFVEGDSVADEAYRLVQVCYDMGEPSTRKREISALREAMAKFSCAEGFVITTRGESEERVPEGVIRIVPAWKWFLEQWSMQPACFLRIQKVLCSLAYNGSNWPIMAQIGL